jgi:hypothetical protein
MTCGCSSGLLHRVILWLHAYSLEEHTASIVSREEHLYHLEPHSTKQGQLIFMHYYHVSPVPFIRPYLSCFVFARFYLQISVWDPAILTKGFRSLPQSVHKMLG